MDFRPHLLTLACLATVACDKGSEPTSPPAEERITGSERVGWDQEAGDSGDFATFRYAIYVDGTRSELADASCDSTPRAVGFACSARLPAMSPGAHTLELASFVVADEVLESSRSSPLRVFVAGATVRTAERASAWRPGTVLATTDHVRLRIDLVADGLSEPTDVAFAPDGRLFVAERGGGVRVVRDGRLRAEPALAIADIATAGQGGLLGLAFDPRFEQTRHVYALYTVPSPSGGRVFWLARFRETGDTLGDRVILLDDIPASAARAAASLRFGVDGKLYIAFDDGGDPRRAGDMAAFNGKILRMNPDGSTPDDQAGATPVYSYEYRSPRGLDWQPGTGLLWIADVDDPQGSTRLSAVAAGEGRPRRAVVRATQVLPPPTGASAVVFYRGALIPAFRDNLLVATDEGRHILRIRFDPKDPTRIATTERLLEDRLGGVRAVVVAPDGTIYFCTANALAKLVPAQASGASP
jgi:glucose/arabinose dehydrogenase